MSQSDVGCFRWLFQDIGVVNSALMDRNYTSEVCKEVSAVIRDTERCSRKSRVFKGTELGIGGGTTFLVNLPLADNHNHNRPLLTTTTTTFILAHCCITSMLELVALVAHSPARSRPLR